MILTERIKSESLLQAINMLKVMAHPVRLALVDVLTEHEKLSVLEIQEKLNIPQAIASQHITLMEDKGVLVSKRIGRRKYVSLRFPKIKNIIECLENCCKEI